MKQSEKMAALVAELLKKHQATVSEFGVQLVLTQPQQGYLLIEELTPEVQMRVAYLFFDRHGEPLSEPDLFFWVREGEWIPYMMQRTTTGRQVYGDLSTLTHELTLQDEAGQMALAQYADWFAENLRAQGWMEKAYKAPDGAGLTTIFPSPRMQQLIEDLASRYHVDLNDPDAYLRLEMPDRDDCLVIQRVGSHISMARYVVKNGVTAPDPDMVFRLERPAAWPIQFSWSTRNQAAAPVFFFVTTTKRRSGGRSIPHSTCIPTSRPGEKS